MTRFHLVNSTVILRAKIILSEPVEAFFRLLKEVSSHKTKEDMEKRQMKRNLNVNIGLKGQWKKRARKNFNYKQNKFKTPILAFSKQKYRILGKALLFQRSFHQTHPTENTPKHHCLSNTPVCFSNSKNIFARLCNKYLFKN